MGRFNPNDYATVEDRLPLFWEAHPAGRIETELLRCSDDFQSVVVFVRLYREGESVPFATGMAEEHQGGGGPNRDCWLENCETSAIGRALANAGWQGSIGGKKAPRPSREEMSKVDRGGEPAASDGMSSQKQQKMIYAKAKGYYEEAFDATFKPWLTEQFGTDDTRKLTAKQASEVIDFLKGLGA